MAIRLTGMASGLDTEAMITDLMSAYSLKKTKMTKKNTRFSWKMDAWKEMNTKIKNFYSKSLSNMRFSSAYKGKKTTVSDATKASVTASNNAVTGSQTLAIKQLAQAGYLTGATVSKADGTAAKGSTTLSEMGYNGASSITVKVGSKETSIDLNGDMKISDVVSKLNGAGVTASFDEKNQRMFISAKNTGKEFDFTITGDTDDATMALSTLGIYEGSDSDVIDKAATYGVTKGADGKYAVDTTSAAFLQSVEDMKDSLTSKYLLAIDAANKAVEDAQAAKEEAAEKKAEQQALLGLDENGERIEGAGGLLDEYEASAGYAKALEILNAEDFKASDYGIKDADTEQDKVAKIIAKKQRELSKIDEDELTDEQRADLEAFEEATGIRDQIKEAQTELKDAENTITKSDATIEAKNQEVTDTQGKLENVDDEALEKVTATANAAAANLSKNAGAKAVRIVGQDAEIFLNGAFFSSSKNNFDINGLSITVTGTTGLAEDAKDKDPDSLTAEDFNTISLTTDVDVDGIYDTIKNFLKSYNELIKEMDTAYNAASASKYDPLTDEEKDAMTDTEVELWEKKIKDSLLRRDDSLNTVINVMKNAMTQRYKVGDERMSLSSFGIETLSYFLAGDNEKGMFHIDGDSDDENTSANDDKLRKAILADPEGIQKFFSQLATNMYDGLQKAMRATTGSSSMTVYNDKEMKSTYDSYLKDVEDYESKLNKIEDKYYKMFAKMEKAMSSMQSSTNALAGLLGGGQ